MREAEAAAGVPPDAETYAQFLPDGGDTPQDEVPEEADTAPVAEATEPEPVDEAEAPAEEPPPLLAGMYKTVEALEQAYSEAQRRLGELGNEVGQLRQLRT